METKKVKYLQKKLYRNNFFTIFFSFRSPFEIVNLVFSVTMNLTVLQVEKIGVS